MLFKVLSIFFLLSFALSAHANSCLWLLQDVYEGTSYSELTPKWDRNACGVGHRLTYRIKNSNGLDVSFTDSPSGILKHTFPLTGETRSANIEIEVLCDGFTEVCSNGMVFFLIHPKETSSSSTTSSQTPSKNTTSSTSSTSSSTAPSENSTSSSTSSTAAPVATCKSPSPVVVEVSEAKEFTMSDYYDHCPNAFVSLESQQNSIGSSEKFFSLQDEKLVFQSAPKEGTYFALMMVSCSDGSSCVVSVRVIAKETPSTSTPIVKDCKGSYVVKVVAADAYHGQITAQPEDTSDCPGGVVQFKATSSPRYNPENFSLSLDGTLSYLAPISPDYDSFDLTLHCSTSPSVTMCKASTNIIISAAPSSSPSSTTSSTATPGSCPGKYQFNYNVTDKDELIPEIKNLTASLWDNGVECAEGSVPTIRVIEPKGKGTVSLNETSGEFSYTTSEIAPFTDSFSFQFTCGDFSCSSTALLVLEEKINPSETYILNENTIFCRGTCDSGADLEYDGKNNLRKDSRSSDDVSFDFNEQGELIIRAYTRLYNMAARFVTFTPLSSSDSLIDKSSVPPGSHMSFEPACLAKQAENGTANTIWTWDNASQEKGHLNTDTKEYKSGANYYHTFGGNHRYCDVYRRDSCTYAPFMTPTLNDDNNNIHDNSTPSIQWKLYINDCDATWVGQASVESLRALRQPDGSATFKLINDTQMSGTVYSQAIRPVSWTDPNAGVEVTEQKYELVLKIKNNIVVDLTVMNSPSNLQISNDVQYATAEDHLTVERVYAYSILLYPYHYYSENDTVVSFNSTSIKEFSLINYTWKAPSAYDCEKCTGKKYVCIGTGNKYETDCGAEGVVQFENVNDTIITFDQDPSSLGGSNLFPSTNLRNQFLNHSFFVRVLGEGSARSADGSPIAQFFLKFVLTSGETVVVQVNQTNYVSEINTDFVRAEACRASAYWPVADALGNSLPVEPYTNSTYAKVELSPNLMHLLPEEQCMEGVGANTNVTLTHMTGKVPVGNVTLDVSMCAVEDGRTYGVTDWVLFSLPSIQEVNFTNVHLNGKSVIVTGTSESMGEYTIAELQYLVLSVKSTEAISFLKTLSPEEMPSDLDEYINILLDGSNPPQVVDNETAIWMSDDPSHVIPAASVTYYNWTTYASFLNYRRVRLNTPTDHEPFNFAFIPGALLHSSSSVRVPFNMKASIKFSTYKISTSESESDVLVSEREEKMFYVITVSRATSAALRFDTDVYSPSFVTLTTSGIARKTASWLLIVFFVAVVVVLAASIYVEVTYKRKIHNAKYNPKRPDSAVGIRYGRDGKPKPGYGYENDSTIAGSTANKEDISSGVKPKKTTKGGETASKFGTIHSEQVRVKEEMNSDDDENTQENKKVIGEDQERVSNNSNEKASF